VRLFSALCIAILAPACCAVQRLDLAADDIAYRRAICKERAYAVLMHRAPNGQPYPDGHVEAIIAAVDARLAAHEWDCSDLSY